MKKKIVAILLAVLMLATLLAGCQQPSSNGGNDDTATRTFTVGFDAEFPPYGYIDDNGDYDGFDDPEKLIDFILTGKKNEADS